MLGMKMTICSKHIDQTFAKKRNFCGRANNFVFKCI